MLADLKTLISNHPNFPKPGVLFREISPLLFDVAARKEIMEAFWEYIQDKNITVIAGIDARGFILWSMLAEKYQLPLVMIRKEGKLPDTIVAKASYESEYSHETLTIRNDLLSKNNTVLIADDILATGGTLQAAIELIKGCGAQKIYAGVLVELLFLKWREKLAPIDIFSTIQYD